MLSCGLITIRLIPRRKIRYSGSEIVNIEANVQEASYYGNQTNKTVEQISSYFEWFEENPLEQQET